MPLPPLGLVLVLLFQVAKVAAVGTPLSSPAPPQADPEPAVSPGMGDGSAPVIAPSVEVEADPEPAVSPGTGESSAPVIAPSVEAEVPPQLPCLLTCPPGEAMRLKKVPASGGLDSHVTSPELGPQGMPLSSPAPPQADPEPALMFPGMGDGGAPVIAPSVEVEADPEPALMFPGTVESSAPVIAPSVEVEADPEPALMSPGTVESSAPVIAPSVEVEVPPQLPCLLTCPPGEAMRLKKVPVPSSGGLDSQVTSPELGPQGMPLSSPTATEYEELQKAVTLSLEAMMDEELSRRTLDATPEVQAHGMHRGMRPIGPVAANASQDVQALHWLPMLFSFGLGPTSSGPGSLPQPQPPRVEEEQTLPYDELGATQNHASQEESQENPGGLAATQAYQDEDELLTRALKASKEASPPEDGHDPSARSSKD